MNPRLLVVINFLITLSNMEAEPAKLRYIDTPRQFCIIVVSELSSRDVKRRTIQKNDLRISEARADWDVACTEWLVREVPPPEGVYVKYDAIWDRIEVFSGKEYFDRLQGYLRKNFDLTVKPNSSNQ